MGEEESALQDGTVNQRKKIEIKFKVLDLKENESTRIIERGKIIDTEKHVIEIETCLNKIQHLKGKIQELMIKDDKAWNNQVESDLQRYVQSLAKLQQCLKELGIINQIEEMREQESMKEYRNESNIRKGQRLRR